MPESQIINAIAYQISIIVSEKNDKPVIELRKNTSDPEIMKQIISCAFHNKPIIVQPTFTDRLKAMAALQEKGIIYKSDVDQQYYFTF